jgi:putative chitinase
MTGALITAAQLQRFAPRCDVLAMAPALDAACRRFEITTPRRLRHFLGQVHHESMGLTRLEEALSYSADRLCEVWPGRFPSVASAAPYARNPRALANKVYGGRLGNVGPDDGWRYRGRGLLMTTGRQNYFDSSIWTGLDLVAQPELLGEPKAAAQAAAAYWNRRGCNALADRDDIELITRRINGGLIGLADRRTQTQRAGLIWRE